jgi:hypothetical protein
MNFQSVDIVAPSAVSKSRKHLPWIALALCTLAAVAIFAVIAVAPSDNQTELPVSLETKKSKAPAATIQDVNADLAGLQDDLNTAIRDLQKASKARNDKNAKDSSALKKGADLKKPASKEKKISKAQAAHNKEIAATKKKIAKKAAAACAKNPVCAKKQADDKKRAAAACAKSPICVKKEAAAKKAAAAKKTAVAELLKIKKLEKFINDKRKEVKKALATQKTLEKLMAHAAHKSKPVKLLVAVATATSEVEESMYSVSLKTSVARNANSAVKTAKVQLDKLENELKLAAKASNQNAINLLTRSNIPKAIKVVDTARFKQSAADDDLARAVERLNAAKGALSLANKRLN